ncbi:Eco57I restriction-modification methylase domain-containing protein [Methylocystis echinoides]|uniref:site-specific DNA-methyltransferase (adenine-specific) n=1 Tax=Methylocystis echinoides TaxID=29468 RepID=A0A9W6LU83_9HYPH|nr:N-6 DNA methylase [Methylocystis echinoides]GLI95286.1 RNA methyltransferase [Methylocystis echinoides]
MTVGANKLHLTEPSARSVASAQSADAIQAFDKFLAAFRKKKLGRSKALQVCLSLIKREPGDLLELLAALPAAWADHAVASVYATLIPVDRRKKLGAYFTPPHLVDHLLSRLASCGMDPVTHRLRDPAAGGAAFLVPLARIKVSAWKERGLADSEIVHRLGKHLVGREIEPDLAAIANALLRRMLVCEFQLAPKLVARLRLVKVGDSLDPRLSSDDDIDHEVGNPPFLRLGGSDKRLATPIFREIASGRVNLYALFVRRALAEVPIGGMIGYVIPASFLGGPEFESFRRRVLQLAEVLVVDLIEKRSDVFLDAIQDACFVVLRRRAAVLAEPHASVAASGVFRRDGKFVSKDVAHIEANGAPWRLPGIELVRSSTLKDWGYRATVGYLVANRQPKRLHKRAAKGRYPLIWAKAITPEGIFDFERGAAFKGYGWADAPADAPYVVRTACVAIQRTSSRGQKRRLNAASISKAFIKKHGGVIAENHVILLLPNSPDAASPESLAKALNNAAASAALDRVCGSASISVRLLETIKLEARPSTYGC